MMSDGDSHTIQIPVSFIQTAGIVRRCVNMGILDYESGGDAAASNTLLLSLYNNGNQIRVAIYNDIHPKRIFCRGFPQWRK